MMGSVARDARIALRSFRRAPTFAVTAVLILGLGIGAATAMFTIADSVLRRPLPVRDQDRIVLPRIVDERGTDLALSVEELKGLRAASRSMPAIAGEAHQGAFTLTLRDGDRPLVMRAAWVTGNFFEVLGARPTLGRLFRTADESPDEASVLVISYETWRQRFGGDSGIIGHRLANPYTTRRYTIIGVAPVGLDYPVGAEYWSPTVYQGGLDIVARLAPGVGSEAARQEFLSTMRELWHGESGRVDAIGGARLRALPEAVVGNVRLVFRVLGVAVSLLLLLAGVNVGNLLLLRVTGRRQEIAIRRSLGARAGDIVRHVLVESGALAIAGGVVGLALAVGLVRLFVRLAPAGVPRIDVVRFAAAPVAAAVALTLLAGLVIGLIPAVAAAAGDLESPLRADARAGSRSVAQRRLRHAFVASQVAVALIVLVGAGLVVRSLGRLERLDLGYQPRHVSLIWLATPVTPKDAEAGFAALLDRVVPGLREVPGVVAVTPLVIAPFYGPQVFNAPWEVAGQSAARGAPPRLAVEGGGRDYFRTLEIPLLRGRGFLDSDRAEAPKVAVVSEAAAQALSLGPDPIGRRIRVAGDTTANAWRTIVGVAADIHYRELTAPTPTIFLPSRQFFFQGLVAIRSPRSLPALLPDLRRAVLDADPAAVIARTETMDRELGRQRALPRLVTLLLSGFGAVALLLAVIGLYGLMASLVRAGTREIGVRIALGATPARMRRAVLGRALVVTGAGVLAGLAGAVGGTRILTSVLFQVSPTDPVTLTGVSLLLLAAALCAAYLPARRAMRIDPALALRSE